MAKRKRPGLFATQTRHTSYKPRKSRAGHVYRVKWSTRLKRWVRRKWRTTKKRWKRNRQQKARQRQPQRIYTSRTTVQPGPDGQPTTVTTEQATAKGPPPEGATSTCKLGGTCGQVIVYTGGRWEHVEHGNYECFQPY